MSRVPYQTRDEFPVEHVAAYDRLLRERGASNIFLALANIPNLLDPLLTFTREMKFGAAIAQPLRELAIVSVGHFTGSQYEFDHHWNIALAAGLPREKMENLADWETSDVYDERDRAIIRYAREATFELKVHDATWDALRAHFSVREAMDVVMAVAWYNAVVRMLLPLEIELEQGFKRG
jgi:alkylhydroperoxidase family enzyme